MLVSESSRANARHSEHRATIRRNDEINQNRQNCATEINHGRRQRGEKDKKKYNGNVEIRTACGTDEKLLESIHSSLEQPKKLIESVLSQLSLKDVPFNIYEPATDEKIKSHVDSLKSIDPNIEELISKKDLAKFPRFKTFFDKHCVMKTYYFHIKKCLHLTCTLHTPLNSTVEIERFPDPIPPMKMALDDSKKDVMTKRSNSLHD